MTRSVALVLLTFAGCAKPPTPPPAAALAPTDDLLAVAWYQTSAEAHAASLTVYQAAAAALDQALADPTWTAAIEQTGDPAALPPAIIVDVDETVLDNSPYQVRNLLDGARFAPPTWDAWVAEAKADPLPGAAPFLAAAAARGVAVVYVSNRAVGQEEPTRPTLAAHGFPHAATVEAMRFRPAEGDRSKSARRAQIAATHRVVMMFGDNLFDFVEADKPDRDARAGMVDAHAAWWGRRWFMLANPMYGSWDDALLGHERVDANEAHTRRLNGLDPKR